MWKAIINVWTSLLKVAIFTVKYKTGSAVWRLSDSEVTWPVLLFVRLLGHLVGFLLFSVPAYLVFIQTIALKMLTWSDVESYIYISVHRLHVSTLLCYYYVWNVNTLWPQLGQNRRHEFYVLLHRRINDWIPSALLLLLLLLLATRLLLLKLLPLLLLLL